MLDDEQLKVFEEKLEAAGEEKVCKNLVMGIYGYPTDPRSKAPLVQDWLKKKENQREIARREKELEIAEEANKIAKESNKIARSAKNAAWWAIVISIISALISILVLIFTKIK